MKENDISNKIMSGLVNRAQKIEIKNVFNKDTEEVLTVEA